MKYKHGERRKPIEYEKALVEYWKKNQTFEKSIKNLNLDKNYVFYDGPPFITGNPHHGTLLSSVVKDAVPRFWTMNGYRVERRWGWDCHGLPAENFTEKHLGGTVSRTEDPAMLELKIGEETSEISLQKYIETARDLMVANSATWESTIDRIGRWVDFKGAYKTMDKDFMESVWWAFKELYKKRKIYEGEKVLMYDTTFATPVSKNEVTMDNDAYQTVTDPSVYVKFKLTKDSARQLSNHIDSQAPNYSERLPLDADIYMLAWTTTPWTLPGNTALAVHPDLTYAIVETAAGTLIIAQNLINSIFKEQGSNTQKPDQNNSTPQEPDQELYKVTQTITGADLVGLSYEPIFPELNPRGDSREGAPNFGNLLQNRGGTSAGRTPRPSTHKIHAADYVGDTEGTGIVHLAPIYGEEDFALAEKENIPKLHVIDDHGYYYPEVAEQLHKIGVRNTDEKGIEVWAANKFIAKCLEEQGTVWKIDYIRHEYPFNPRSKQRIMYRVIPSWFFDIQGSKQLMLEKNQNINWFPDHLKNGRFAKNIEQAPDWNLSRDRFWATPMPVWKGDKGSIHVVGSYAELKDLSGVELDDYHRPWIDSVELQTDKIAPEIRQKYEFNGQPGETFTRIDKVLDCWFESGSMPFAQLHYPFENKEKFEQNYPADFIVEYIGQVRAWFYYVHVVNTALFGREAYKNVITTGTLAGNDGRKMSKSLGNYTDPNELMDKYSADALRFLMLSSPVLSGEDFALLDKDVSDISRKLAMVWNMYDFFTMYAEVDGWEYIPDQHIDLENPLDLWIISRLHQLKADITKNMQAYNLPDALSGVLPFIDDASNWYVRRSRRRFWKSEDDADKSQAYYTLHLVLRKLAVLLAPFTPFLAEELHQKLTGEESVHLLSWLTNTTVNTKVIKDMSRAREIIEKGLAARMDKSDPEGQIKVRQPLSELEYNGAKLDNFYEQIIAEEVNVKKVTQHPSSTESTKSSGIVQVRLNKKLTPELREEGFARELIRFIQSARKTAGLSVDDRINLSISHPLPNHLKTLIQQETLATTLTENQNYTHDELITIDNKNITISLQKA